MRSHLPSVELFSVNGSLTLWHPGTSVVFLGKMNIFTFTYIHFYPSPPLIGCYGVAADDVREQWSCDRCTEGSFTAVRLLFFPPIYMVTLFLALISMECNCITLLVCAKLLKSITDENERVIPAHRLLTSPDKQDVAVYALFTEEKNRQQHKQYNWRHHCFGNKNLNPPFLPFVP